MGSVPNFLSDDMLVSWIKRAELALRHYDMNKEWAAVVGRLLWNDWVKNSARADGAKHYLELLHVNGSDEDDLSWWRLEHMFWSLACQHYGSVPAEVAKVLEMAENFEVDEWGRPV